MAKHVRKSQRPFGKTMTLWCSAAALCVTTAAAIYFQPWQWLPQLSPPSENTQTAPQTSSTEPIITEPEPMTARITVTGDMMVHKWQLTDALNNGTDGAYSFQHNFEDVTSYFQQADLAIANLETTLCGPDLGYSDYPLFGTPDAFAQAIKDAGFDVLSTANNHCMDKGSQGLTRTLNVLDEMQIAHMGTYASQEARDQILMLDVNGIQVALLSYTYGTNGIPVPQSYMVNLMDDALMCSDIERAREQGADFIIVMPHMGIEYETSPRQDARDTVQMLFEAGADAVLASHPHVLQPMEYHTITESDGSTRTAFVIYSLGNAISSQETFPRNGGVILNLDIEKQEGQRAKLTSISVIPTWTQFHTNSGTHFKIRTLYHMLTSPTEEEQANLRSADRQRLEQLHHFATSTLFGQDIPLENISEEYVFPAA